VEIADKVVVVSVVVVVKVMVSHVEVVSTVSVLTRVEVAADSVLVPLRRNPRAGKQLQALEMDYGG
jgi:hypothetical protein